MLNHHRKRAVALGFALLLLAGLGSFPVPSCEPPKPSGKTEEPGNNYKKECPTIFGAVITYTGHFIHDNRDEITAGSTAIIAFFTVILGVFTIRLAKSTRIAAIAAKDSANVAKDSLVIANRPRIVPRLEFCESNESTWPQIRFSLRNRGKVALVSRVDVTAQTIRAGIGLGKTFTHVPIIIDSEIEAGQKLGGYQFTLDYLGVPDPLQGIKSGEITLKIIFQIISKDMFGKDYKPTISFDFDHGKGVFAPSKLLKPENK